VTGTEDFIDCEGTLHGAGMYDPIFFQLVDQNAPRELCSNMGRSWAWAKQFADRTQKESQLWMNLSKAGAQDANWLLNTGPMPSGKIAPNHVDSYKKLGEMIRDRGFPKREGEGYHEFQDKMVGIFEKKFMFKSKLKALKGTKDEKKAAASVLSNHVFSMTIPPFKKDRRQHYYKIAMDNYTKYKKSYKDGDVYDFVKKCITLGNKFNAASGKGGIFRSIETE
jgi:hypothetical protein